MYNTIIDKDIIWLYYKCLLALQFLANFNLAQEAIVSEITRQTNPTGKSALVHHRRKFLQSLQKPRVREALNIDYGILGRQFHFEKLDPKDPTSRIGCYGEPNRETTYYMANSNGYQTLKESQFLEVTHLFPTKCATASNNFGGNIKFESTQSPIVQQQLQRNARLSSDNQRMAHSIQSKLKENSITDDANSMQPTMVLLVPFCPNTESEALTFLQKW